MATMRDWLKDNIYNSFDIRRNTQYHAEGYCTTGFNIVVLEQLSRCVFDPTIMHTPMLCTIPST